MSLWSDMASDACYSGEEAAHMAWSLEQAERERDAQADWLALREQADLADVTLPIADPDEDLPF